MPIAVSPSQLTFELKKVEIVSQKLFLQNLDSHPTKISIAVSRPKFAKKIEIKPQELILPPLTPQEVEVRILHPKNFKTELEILALSIQKEGLVALAPGVKIPLEVKVQEASDWTFGLALILALLATFVVYLFKQKTFLVHKKS